MDDIREIIGWLASDYLYGQQVTEEEARRACEYIAREYSGGGPSGFPHGVWGDHAHEWAIRALAIPPGVSIRSTAHCAARGVIEHERSSECHKRGCHAFGRRR